MDLATLKRAMGALGVTRLYAKVLAPNDNSKNQPYFGGDFSVLNIIPMSAPIPDKSGTAGAPIFKAAVDFHWLQTTGRTSRAPHAKFIFYPQYPEVRFSGYLRGCEIAPSDVMGKSRVPGRVLFLGIAGGDRVIGYAVQPESELARELEQLSGLQRVGVFVELPLASSTTEADRAALLGELCRISTVGWIPGKQLNEAGIIDKCVSSNCGGYTLEAELGIAKNGKADPDFRGWEVKQYGVRAFGSDASARITLMTPEPSAGAYRRVDLLEFVRLYGYADRRGRPDRLNFGGTHVVDQACGATGLTMRLSGYDHVAGKITDAAGGITLWTESGVDVATWSYSALMDHWNRKHALAVYVPSRTLRGSVPQYMYSPIVRLGTGTDFLKFLSALSAGAIYYDPGIKVEGCSTAKPRRKKRSQFRITSKNLHKLYNTIEDVDTRLHLE